MCFTNTPEPMNEINSIYQEMLPELIQNGTTKVTNLEKLDVPRRGYSGIVYYQEKGFRFEAEIDFEDDPSLSITIPLSVTVDERHMDDIHRLVILSNYLIEGDGDILYDANGSVYLSKTIWISRAAMDNRANNIMRSLAGIAYAFVPYYMLINKGEGYRLKINYGGSLLAQLIYHLIPSEAENPSDDSPWYDDVEYRGEQFYQILSCYYDRESAHISHLLTEYEIRKMLLDKINSLTTHEAHDTDNSII